MQVAQVMWRDGIASCSPRESLSRAAQQMWENDCGAIPVIEDGVVVAMLTDRDVCMAAYTQNRPLTEIEVATAMSRRLVTCSPGDDLGQVLEAMKEHQVRRLPVVDADCRLVGIVTQNDLVREANQRRSGLSTGAVISALAGIGDRHGLILSSAEQSELVAAEASARAGHEA